jgi:GTP-binding protein
MRINKAQFISSTQKLSQLPAPDKPEYAFIGRSNVGKSSLINLLTGQKKLTRTSKTPGRTRAIQHYLINNKWYLVDLPGYGFAKVQKKARKQWQKAVRSYLKKRASLQCVFMLIDANIPPQEKDIQFINWMGEWEIPFVLVFTKIDKPNQKQLNQNTEQFTKALKKYWEYLPDTFYTSAKQQKGREPMLRFISEVNEKFEKPFTLR